MKTKVSPDAPGRGGHDVGSPVVGRGRVCGYRGHDPRLSTLGAGRAGTKAPGASRDTESAGPPPVEERIFRALFRGSTPLAFAALLWPDQKRDILAAIRKAMKGGT
jgi:hypothetical protein